jgi:hypothetical protein
MTRWLAIAEWLCGARARRDVFEPLIADWEREWRDASHSTLARTRIITSGSTALVIALITCLVTRGMAMTRTALIKGVLTLAISSVAVLALQVALVSQQLPDSWILELRVWMALPRVLTVMIPLAILPTMMLWRGVAPSSRAAIITITGASVLTVFVAGWLAPRTEGQPPFIDRWQEALYQRSLENDRAGRYTYPGSVGRVLHPTTPEQRAEARRRWRGDPRYLADQARLTRPRWNARNFMVGGLTIALGTLGWALGALGRTRPIHVVGWWTLSCVALMLFDGQFRFWIDSTRYVRIDRPPDWLPLAVFGTAAIVLLVAARQTEVTASRR